MRIGIDASRLAVAARTGTEHYSWEIIRALGAIDRRNSYVLYCNRRPAALPPLPPTFSLACLPLRYAWSHGRLSLEMLLAPPDVLFVPAHALPLVPAPRSVVTIHDLGFRYHPEAHTRAQRLYHRVFTALSVRRATQIIAISEATKRDLRRFYRLPDDKITVVYHGVDQRFRPIDDPATIAATLERYGIRQPYLLFVSTIQPRKNVARLIDAFALARQQAATPDVTLVLAGKRGWLTGQIERRAAERGIAGQVRFLGYVADADLPALLSGALAYVLPSLYEGFGRTILEAQACGTPVLASNVSSLPEVVGEAGLLVDPYRVEAIADGLARLLSDSQLRAELRQRGLAHAAGWTWERAARQTLEVLERAAR